MKLFMKSSGFQLINKSIDNIQFEVFENIDDKKLAVNSL